MVPWFLHYTIQNIHYIVYYKSLPSRLSYYIVYTLRTLSVPGHLTQGTECDILVNMTNEIRPRISLDEFGFIVKALEYQLDNTDGLDYRVVPLYERLSRIYKQQKGKAEAKLEMERLREKWIERNETTKPIHDLSLLEASVQPPTPTAED